MAGIYARTISIRRPVQHSEIGGASYSALGQSDETTILTGLAASIQAKSAPLKSPATDLPTAPPGPVQWIIFLPKAASSLGQIHERDIVVDEVGDRYHVEAAYWNILGYQLKCVKLDAR